MFMFYKFEVYVLALFFFGFVEIFSAYIYFMLES